MEEREETLDRFRTHVTTISAVCLGRLYGSAHPKYQQYERRRASEQPGFLRLDVLGQGARY